MVFVAIVIPVAVRGLTTANRAGVVADRKSVAAQLAERKLNEVVVTDVWRSAEKEGNFGEERAGYRWILKDGAWEEDTMRVVSVEVFFEVQGREYSVGLSTLVEEAEQ
jgi:ribosomal protein L17